MNNCNIYKKGKQELFKKILNNNKYHYSFNSFNKVFFTENIRHPKKSNSKNPKEINSLEIQQKNTKNKTINSKKKKKENKKSINNITNLSFLDYKQYFRLTDENILITSKIPKNNNQNKNLKKLNFNLKNNKNNSKIKKINKIDNLNKNKIKFYSPDDKKPNKKRLLIKNYFRNNYSTQRSLNSSLFTKINSSRSSKVNHHNHTNEFIDSLDFLKINKINNKGKKKIVFLKKNTIKIGIILRKIIKRIKIKLLKKYFHIWDNKIFGEIISNVDLNHFIPVKKDKIPMGDYLRISDIYKIKHRSNYSSSLLNISNKTDLKKGQKIKHSSSYKGNNRKINRINKYNVKRDHIINFQGLFPIDKKKLKTKLKKLKTEGFSNINFDIKKKNNIKKDKEDLFRIKLD